MDSREPASSETIVLNAAFRSLSNISTSQCMAHQYFMKDWMVDLYK